ncbi:MAG TPA: alpha/beta hydrolase [Steroidobacteraceae bacterium]|nr:alpha/beta hydrolase [Steroidobacteraceae bacterium]
MQAIDRRQLLAGSAALLLSLQKLARSAEPPAPPAIPVPANWNSAPRLTIWPGKPPGSDSFAPQPPPANWPAAYVRATAMPELRVFRPARPNGRAILVMPGGAYWFVSVVNEGAELAPRLTARGYTVFVLTYRLPGEGWGARSDVPLQDAQRAMRVIRMRARTYGLDERRIAALGFSAGGHLAATLATRHMERAYARIDTADELDARPWATGLIYPVISMRDPLTHELSRRLLLGDEPSIEQIDRRSAELHVDSETSPLFLCHAIDDEAVPVENSVRMMNAMREAHRPVEAHFLQEGGHAFGVGRAGAPSAQWIDLLCAWLDRSG